MNMSSQKDRQELGEAPELIEPNENEVEELDEGVIDDDILVDLEFDPTLSFEGETMDNAEGRNTEDNAEDITGEISVDNEESEEVEELRFSFDEIIPSVSSVVHRIPEAGVLSVVNAKNGKRVSFAKEVIERIGNPKTLQIGFLEEQIVIGEYLGEAYTTYALKPQGAKRIIYSKELVEQMTNHFALGFTDRTSRTFPSVTYQLMNDECIAVIPVQS